MIKVGQKFSGTDWSTHGRADDLADEIRTYWLSRGYLVRTHIESIRGDSEKGVACIRSDMVNGLPVRRVET